MSKVPHNKAELSEDRPSTAEVFFLPTKLKLEFFNNEQPTIKEEVTSIAKFALYFTFGLLVGLQLCKACGVTQLFTGQAANPSHHEDL